MTEVSRNPDDYRPSDHAYNQMKSRNIGWYETSLAIEEGEVDEIQRPGEKVRLRLSFPGPDLLVTVDESTEKVVTVFYDDSQGAQRGGI